MILPSANSFGSAGPVSPPPPLDFFLVLPDGSCIPATPETCRIIMRQVRSDLRKQVKIKRQEKAVELQMAIEDRAAARSVQKELAELHRGSIRWAARFRVRAEPTKSETRTSPVTKRVVGTAIKVSGRGVDAPRPASSWVTDAMGMKGVIWQQSYLGRKSPKFYPGATRESWEYIVRDEAVLLDDAGEPIIISNIGENWIEIGAGWQAMEDASMRANAKIQLLAIAPFDSDMSEGEMIAALNHFCTTVFNPLDLPYSAAIHSPPAGGDSRNFHPHIAFSLRPMRRIEPYCWEVADDVCGELDGRDGVQMLRHLWAHSMSVAAEKAGTNRRYTGLGYGARRLDLEAGVHLGEGRSAIVARGGHVWAHERNRIKAERNAARRAIRDADRKIAALTAIRDAAIRRIEQRLDDVAVAKVMRKVQPVDVAVVRAHFDTPATAIVLHRTDDPASTTILAASTPIVPATFIEVLRSAVPHEQTAATITAPAAPVVIAASTAATPAIACQRAGPKIEPMVFKASPPVTTALRRRTSKSAIPAARYKTAVAFIATRGREPASRIAPVAALAAAVPPVGARTRTEARRARPSVAVAAAPPRTVGPTLDSAALLFELLARARSVRLRLRCTAAGAGKLQLDKLPVLGDLPALDALPSLETLEFVATGAAAASVDPLGEEDQRRVNYLIEIDAYVADYGGEDGQVETDYPALKSIGVGWDWLQVSGVQRALQAVRDEQRSVVAALATEAAGRPLVFAKSHARFWPRDLSAEHLRRLDRWANDPGFQHDVFEMQQAIARAHVDRDTELRRRTVVAQESRAAAEPSAPDGLGGWRTGAAPVYRGDGVYARIAAFDAATGKPTEQLLMLLLLAGQHPRQVAFAHDGRLMALPGKPVMLGALLHPWRHDDGVAALVTETVRASRAAGISVWPESVAVTVKLYAARSGNTPVSPVGRPAPDLERGPMR